MKCSSRLLGSPPWTRISDSSACSKERHPQAGPHGGGGQAGGFSARLGLMSACAGVAALMLLPVPEALAALGDPEACEGERLSIGVSRPNRRLYGGKLTYKVRVAGGDAQVGVDYDPPPEKVTFSAGVNGLRFYVKTVRDGIDEGVEKVRLQLYEPKAPLYGGWIFHQGNWVRVETLVRQTITRRGKIRDNTEDDGGSAAGRKLNAAPCSGG